MLGYDLGNNWKYNDLMLRCMFFLENLVVGVLD